MESISIYERYSELEAKGYHYLLHADVVSHLLLDMDELEITAFVNTVGEVVTFGNGIVEYEEFMSEILTQGVLNIIVVKDTPSGERVYYRCDDMFTLQALEV
jgi:hypothetical protein